MGAKGSDSRQEGGSVLAAWLGFPGYGRSPDQLWGQLTEPAWETPPAACTGTILTPDPSVPKSQLRRRREGE